MVGDPGQVSTRARTWTLPSQLFKAANCPPQLNLFPSFSPHTPDCFPFGGIVARLPPKHIDQKSSCLPPNDFFHHQPQKVDAPRTTTSCFLSSANWYISNNAPAGVEHRVETPGFKNQSAFRPGVANREPVSGESVLQTRKRSERSVAPPRVCGCQKATKHAQSVESDNRSALWEVFPDFGFG